MAIVGPGTPAKGEIDAAVEQRDVAPTILKLMGIDPAEYKGATGKPIAAAIR
jgi:arylsulfatase A-like enzyme